jgi:uncharacterized protein
MRWYFVDTWHFIARTDRLDGDHAAAMSLYHRLSGSIFVTHDAVLTEYLAFVSGAGSANRTAAVKTVREAMRRWMVIPVDRPLFLRALERYGRRPDKAYSLVDCMSMAVMEDHGIRHVLTRDHHFRQEGFEVVSE